MPRWRLSGIPRGSHPRCPKQPSFSLASCEPSVRVEPTSHQPRTTQSGRRRAMTYIVAEPCIGTKDHACVDVCPVECFYEGEDILLIHPEECIDCGACEPECPVTAIFEATQVPEKWKEYIAKNADPFTAGHNLPVSLQK